MDASRVASDGDANSFATDPTPLVFALETTIAAVSAAVASTACVVFELPVWAMFIGWVAFLSRGRRLISDGLVNWICVVVGAGFGIGAGLATGAIASTLGIAALPIVVFFFSLVIVSLRACRPFSNLQAYFLGLIAYFAAHSHMHSSWKSLTVVMAATAIGSLTGWVNHRIQKRTVATQAKSQE